VPELHRPTKPPTTTTTRGAVVGKELTEMSVTDDDLHWYEPMDYFSTCDEETGSQRLPITVLNQLRWDAGDLLEFGIEFHMSECSRPECDVLRQRRRCYVLRQRCPDGTLADPWGYCITMEGLHGFLRGIHFGAQEITKR
jgi:hypothetical protein